MDPNTGRIYELTEEQRKEFELECQRLIPLSERQHEALLPMGSNKRRGYMRNQPCICGSGKKFKRCCWSKYA